MLQRLSKSNHRLQENSSSSRPNGHTQDVISLNVPNPPATGKVDHHSIELFWENLDDARTKGDKRLKFTLLEEDKKTKEYSTVYIGYAESYKVEGLDPLQAYKYRLKVSTSDGDVTLSPSITVCTTDEPYNSEHLHRAALKGDLELLSKILATGHVNIDVNDKIGFTPLMNAAQKGNFEVVGMLLELHADVNAVNSSGKNSLMLACYSGHLNVVKKLYEAGALWDSCDKGGSTPLHWAIDGANVELIDFMVKEGAPVNMQDTNSGWTPLMRCAAVSGNQQVAEILIKGGASVNARDHDGKSALMIASLNGHLSLVETLVEHGAEIEARSGHGKSALEMAQAFDRRPVAKYLDSVLEDEREERRLTEKQESTTSY